MARTGRPKKPVEEKFIARSIRFHPRVWEEFSELVPEGSRSALIHRLLERELKRLRRQHVKSRAQTERPHEPPAADPEWQSGFGQLLEKAQRNAAASGLSPEELEREVTLAREEVRELHRARRP